MRCPKCHYLSFEPEPRCRNCGYDLTFEPADVVVKADSSEPAVPDLDLVLHAADPIPSSPAEASLAGPAPASRQTISSTATASSTSELPLFVRGLSENIVQTPTPAPASEAAPGERAEGFRTARARPSNENIALPRAPRPLSVRRPTPAPNRVREKYQHASHETRREIGLLERDLLEGLEAAPPTPAVAHSAPVVRPVSLAAEHREEAAAGTGKRLEAAVIDAVFLGVINVAIVWLTLQRLNLTMGELALLPMLPLATLLFLLDGLYLLMFTATNGQTIGKMTAGIRVVAASDDQAAGDRVTLKQAVLRALLTFPSVLALGAGFLPALFGDGLALHDRFAHTRVVRT
jgi:uncharacterized RDD family membrane protein YckC